MQIQQRKRRREVSISFLTFNLIHDFYLDKKKAAPAAELGVRDQDNSELRLLGSWAPGPWKQSIDYTIPVNVQEKSNNYKYAAGEWMDHPGDANVHRKTDKECAERDKLSASRVSDLRRAAECHRQVRHHA